MIHNNLNSLLSAKIGLLGRLHCFCTHGLVVKVWRAPPGGVFDATQTLNVYSADVGKSHIDLLRLAPWRQLRHEMQTWRLDPNGSDVKGCQLLSSPQLLTHNYCLTDDDCPPYLMLESLQQQGATGGLIRARLLATITFAHTFYTAPGL